MAIIRQARLEDGEQIYPFLKREQPVDSLEAAFKRFKQRLQAISKIAFPLKEDLRKEIFAKTVLNQR